MQAESNKALNGWLPAFGLVATLHLAAWWGFTHFKAEEVAPQPLPVVQVSLLAPPAPDRPKVTPLPPQPPKAERPRPQPLRSPVAEVAPVAAPTPQPVAAPVRETPPAPAAPPTPAAAPAPAPEPVLEPPRFNAAYLSNPPPPYPLAARRRGVEGTVLVRAEVSTGGECLRAELKRSSGSDMLDQAAVEAVRKWRFVPAKRGSQTVVAWVEVPITFRLEN